MAQSQDQHHSESTLDHFQTPLNVDTNTLPQHEIGKTFASRRIQVASLAMRSSSFGSMNPLFPTKPTVAQQWYQPTSPFVANPLSGTSHCGPSDHDRALLDKTWSVLAPKLESNLQRQTANTQRRRRVTFNDVIEFFEPPPPYDDETDDDIIDSLSIAANDETDDNEDLSLEEPIDQNTTTTGSATLTNTAATDTISPAFNIQDDSLQHTHDNNSSVANIPFSSTESQTSNSTATSWSSSSSSIEYNSNKINALRSPLFNQKINASSCSLPLFQAPSSVVSLVSTPSSTSTTNTMIFRTKGNTIPKNTVLDILERRTQPQIPHARRTLTKGPPSSSSAPPGFHSTLDAVQSEIKQAIERAMASTNDVQQQLEQQEPEMNSSLSSSSSSSSSSNDVLSSTTTLTEATTFMDSDQDVTMTADDDDTSESGLTACNMTDTPINQFGETVLDGTDRIMTDNSGESYHTITPCQVNDDIQQDDWLREDNSQEKKQVNSPKIWHTLENPKDAILPTNATSMVGTNPPTINSVTNGRLYVKVIAAENLDFPIDNDAPSIRCSITNGNDHFESAYHSMEHDIHFNHEFILDDVFPESDLTVILQAKSLPNTNTKRWSKRTSWTDRRKSNGDLIRYIHPENRSLAQTRISLPSIASQCRTTLCTASFALVNGWYRPVKSSSRLGVQEKAVGKIIMELFYLPNVHSQVPNLPINMDACENALNIQKFHQRNWRSGYMTQLGGDVKFWQRRYFELVGYKLYSYIGTMQSPTTWIDLSLVVELVCDDGIHDIASHQTAPDMEATMLVMALESLSPGSSIRSSSSSNSATFDDSTASISTTATSLSSNTTSDHDDLSIKNGFHLKFSNGHTIDFFCDSTDERDQWLHVLKLILGRVPPLPAWLPCIA